MLYSPTNHQSKAETKILVLLISFKIKRHGCFTMPQFQLKCALNYSKITFISFDLNKKIKPLGWGNDVFFFYTVKNILLPQK